MNQNFQDLSSQSSSNESHLRLRAKFVWYIRSRNSFSQSQVYLMLSISYLQVFFMTTRFLRENSPTDYSSLHVGLEYLENIITFDNLFSYSNNALGMSLLFFILLVYFLIIIVSIMAIIRSAKYTQKCHHIFPSILCLVTRFHNPIVFFLINNLCGHILQNYMEDSLDIYDKAALNHVLFVFAILFFIINTLVAFSFDLLLCDSLPSKNPISSKNQYTDQITIIQKLVLTLFWRFLPKDTFVNWLIMVLNLILSITKHSFYYYTYPRYNVQTLKFNAYTLTLEASIVVMAPFMSLLNIKEDINISLTSTIMIVVILLPFLMACIRGIVNKTLYNILMVSPSNLNAYKLAHRIVMLKEIKSYKNKSGEEKNSINKNWLYYTGLTFHRKAVFNEEDGDFLNMDFNEKEVQNHTLRHFLEQTNKRYPRNNLVKLILIRFYVKPLRLLPLAISHLEKLNTFSLIEKLSAELLYLEIQEAITTYYKQTEDLLDMSEYLTTLNQAERFETKVWTQLNLYKTFWTEYSKHSPDIASLYELSEKINIQKKIINKEWDNRTLNKEYSRPFLLYACYLITLADLPQKGQHYIKTYNLLSGSDKDEENSQELTKKNMYSAETFFITIKTDVEHVGKIAKCSSSIKRILYHDPKSLIDTNINQLMSTYIAHNHNHFILNYVKTGHAKFLNRIQSIFIKDKLGCLHKASMYAKVHPFFSQEIYLTAMIRRVKTADEYILVTPQGQIDGTSSGIARKLGIEGKKISMTSVCKDFEKINQIYNHFGYKNLDPHFEENQKVGKVQNKNIEEDEGNMQKFYDKWSTEGDNLQFSISSSNFENSGGQSLECFCQIYNYYFASDFIKVIVIKPSKVEQNLDKRRSQQTVPSKEQAGNSIEKVVEKNAVVEEENSFDFLEISEREKAKEELRPVTTEILSPLGSETNQGLLFSSKYQSRLNESLTKASHREDNTLISPSLIHLKKVPIKKETKTDTEEEGVKKIEVKFRAHDGSMGSSQLTNQARRNRTHNLVTEALKKKGYTKQAYTFLFLCLCLAAALFASRIVLQNQVRNDLNTLDALGTAIDYANTAIDALIYLSRGARLTFLGQKNVINTVASPTAAAYIKTFATALNQYLPILKDANNGLWGSLQKIDEGFRSYVLSPNLRYWDFYPNLTLDSTMMVDTMTGTTLLENQLMHMKAYYAQYGTYNQLDLYHVMRNSCNDLLIQNQNFADRVLNFIETSISHQRTTLSILFAIGIIIIFLGLCLVFAYSFYFYRLEMNKLNIFVRISEQEVNSIQANLDNFEEILTSQDYESLRQSPSSRTSITKDPVKPLGIQKRNKQTFRAANTKRLQRTYLFKMVYWAIMLGLYTVFITIVYKNVYSNGTKFEAGITRLMTVQEYLTNVQLSVVGFYTMFIRNYEPVLENTPVLTVLQRNLAALSTAATNIKQVYMLSDGTIDPAIEPIFSGNICNFVPTADLPKCLLVAPGATQKDLFSVISSMYTLYSNQLAEYLASDMSFTTGQAIITSTFVAISPTAISLRDVFLYMISQARVNFDNIYQTLLHQLSIYLGVNIALFVVLFIVAWFFVIRYLINYNNRLKKLMMVVPVRVIITNKSMKPLLMRICPGQLDAIKNEF